MGYLIDLKKKMYERKAVKLDKKLTEAKVEADYADKIKAKQEELKTYKERIGKNAAAADYFAPLRNVSKVMGKLSEESYYLGNAMLGTPVDRKKPLKKAEKEKLWGK